MKVYIKEVATDSDLEAFILPTDKREILLKKDGWQFNWKNLAQTEDALFYKLALQQSPTKVEGMLMLTLVNDEMLYLNTIEVAPHNYGKTKNMTMWLLVLLHLLVTKVFSWERKIITVFLCLIARPR